MKNYSKSTLKVFEKNWKITGKVLKSTPFNEKKFVLNTSCQIPKKVGVLFKKSHQITWKLLEIKLFVIDSQEYNSGNGNVLDTFNKYALLKNSLGYPFFF